MERKYFKALNFDLDTHQLQKNYPGANYRHAYDDLRRFSKNTDSHTDRVTDIFPTTN